MEEQRRAERLVINLRWIALAAGALIVGRVVSLQALLAAAAVIMGCNLTALIAASSLEAYRRRGLAMAVVTRAGDLIVAALAVRMAQPWPSRAYLLFLFPIIATGYVFGRRRATVGVVGAAVALNTIAALFHRGWEDWGVPTAAAILAQTVMLAAGGLAGLMLRSCRGREAAQEDRRAKLDSLAEMQGLAARPGGPSEALNRIAHIALRGAGAKRAALLLNTTDGHALYIKAAASADGAGVEITADDPVALRVAGTGKAMVVAPTGGEKGALKNEESAEPCACVPLVHHSATASRHVGDTIGVLLVRGELNPPAGGFSDPDLSLLRSLASEAALIYVNTTMHDRLCEAVWRTIRSLAGSLEARDPYTHGHSSRVGMIAAALGREMALDERTVGLMRDAALLHDIGKIGIPDSILRKPASLTAEEWASIKTHPIASEGICRGLDMRQDVLFLIRHHHERLDGSGYPDGLQSHEQPLALRILCVADAFDAMSSDRPYRGALTQEARLRELNRLAGVEFDQQVVETLKRLTDQGALDDLYREMAPAGVAPGPRAAHLQPEI